MRKVGWPSVGLSGLHLGRDGCVCVGGGGGGIGGGGGGGAKTGGSNGALDTIYKMCVWVRAWQGFS